MDTEFQKLKFQMTHKINVYYAFNKQLHHVLHPADHYDKQKRLGPGFK